MAMSARIENEQQEQQQEQQQQHQFPKGICVEFAETGKCRTGLNCNLKHSRVEFTTTSLPSDTIAKNSDSMGSSSNDNDNDNDDKGSRGYIQSFVGIVDKLLNGSSSNNNDNVTIKPSGDGGASAAVERDIFATNDTDGPKFVLTQANKENSLPNFFSSGKTKTSTKKKISTPLQSGTTATATATANASANTKAVSNTNTSTVADTNNAIPSYRSSQQTHSTTSPQPKPPTTNPKPTATNLSCGTKTPSAKSLSPSPAAVKALDSSPYAKVIRYTDNGDLHFKYLLPEKVVLGALGLCVRSCSVMYLAHLYNPCTNKPWPRSWEEISEDVQQFFVRDKRWKKTPVLKRSHQYIFDTFFSSRKGSWDPNAIEEFLLDAQRDIMDNEQRAKQRKKTPSPPINTSKQKPSNQQALVGARAQHIVTATPSGSSTDSNDTAKDRSAAPTSSNTASNSFVNTAIPPSTVPSQSFQAFCAALRTVTDKIAKHVTSASSENVSTAASSGSDDASNFLLIDSEECLEELGRAFFRGELNWWYDVVAVLCVAPPKKRPSAMTTTGAMTTTMASAIAIASSPTKSTRTVPSTSDSACVSGSLIVIRAGYVTYVFDTCHVKPQNVWKFTNAVMRSKLTLKLFHDIYETVSSGSIGTDCATAWENLLDTQLLMECFGCGRSQSLDDFFLKCSEVGDDGFSQTWKPLTRDDAKLVSTRPLSQATLLSISAKALSLVESFQHLQRHNVLPPNGDGNTRKLQSASENRFAIALEQTGGGRHVCFDEYNNYSFASTELVRAFRGDAAVVTMKATAEVDLQPLLSLLPDHLVASIEEKLESIGGELMEIVLEEGRRPYVMIRRHRAFIGDDEVTPEAIKHITRQLSFGKDNRAGLPRQLHRISRMVNPRNSECYSLTLRVGRHVEGNARMLTDILTAEELKNKSVLLLGEPGSGKTTIVRSVARTLSETSTVIIVDTSNEIGGDGNIPHPCVGYSRRMMVASLDVQGSVMVECVQNHTPEVMVVDEIGRPMEVGAAKTCKQRGVRLVASAHGNLRSLVKNGQLNGLVGGVEQVTVGDERAKKEAAQRGLQGLVKNFPQRAGAPIFEVVVEVSRDNRDEWFVVMDAGKAVDRILENDSYACEKRSRNEHGALTVEKCYR